jgi:hypothetical protein
MSIFALFALPWEARGQDKAVLKWKFQKGEQLHYETDADSTSTMKAQVPGEAGLDVKSTISTAFTSAWFVEDVADDGTATISVAQERIRIDVKTPGGELSEDTNVAPEKASERLKALRSVLGETMTLRMTPQGELKEVKLSDRLMTVLKDAAACGLSEEKLKENLRLVALALPGEAVAVGNRWTRLVERPQPGFSFETRELAYTYKGPSEEPFRGSKLIELRTDLAIKADPQGAYRMELRYKSQDGRGFIYFDDTAGYLLGMDFMQKFELGMTMLGKESVSLSEDRVKVRLRLDRKRQSGLVDLRV